jgi:hypothetical protein
MHVHLTAMILLLFTKGLILARGYKKQTMIDLETCQQGYCLILGALAYKMKMH